MAKFKVGSGFGRLPFEAALQRAKPGDLLVLDPGRYDIGQVALGNIRLQGNGTADQIEILGSFTVYGHCTFTNLTIRAVPYKNAIFLKTATDMASLSHCIVHGEAGEKYPTIWCSGGTVVLNQVSTLSGEASQDVRIIEKGKLHATASQLGRVFIKSTKADLIDSTTSFLNVIDGGRVNTFGAHRSVSLLGQREFYVSGESVCSFSQLVLGDEYREGYAKDSIIQIESISQEEGGSFTVMTSGGARVTTASAAVTVVDSDAEPSKPILPAGPKTIHWQIQHAHEFSTKIAPQVNAGDTVVLEEGDYTLDDYDILYLGATLAGQGQRLTRLHGSIGGLASGQATVSNLTICAPDPERSAVYANQSGARLTLENVTLQSTPDATVTTLYASAGAVSLKSCEVVALANQSGQGAVFVVADTQFEAEESEIGWFSASSGGHATLSECTSYSLGAESGATINVIDTHHILANECDHYELWARDGGTLTIQALTTFSDNFCANLEGGTLSLANFGAVEGDTFSVHKRHGEVRGIDPGAYDLYEVEENGDRVLVHEATRGVTAQQQDHERLEQPFPDAPSPDPFSTPSPTGTGSPDSGSQDPLAGLLGLVGLAKVKQQVQGFVNTVKLSRKRAELGLPADDEFTLHSMFLGNPGTGKTTFARLFGKAMHQAGVVENDNFIEAGRAQLISENIGGTAKQTRALLEGGRGGVIFIDEAYALASDDSAGFAEEAVTEILTFMENHRSDTMVILAGYNDKMHELLAVNEGLKSRIKHRFDFEDYSSAEIAEIGLGELALGHYTVNEKLYRRIISTAYAQSSDRSNARWVRSFNQDLRAKQGERVILIDTPTREDLTAIIDADLHALAGGGPEARETNLAEKLSELDAMTGLTPVKEWVRSLVAQANVNQRMIELDGGMERPNYHVAFTGNPGTGKTTVARTIAEIFHSLGILATPTVKSVAASQLIGRYLGHSSDNTHKAFDAAMGGVLFIDEAHQLRGGQGDNGTLRQEVVDAMITHLEDDRDKFVAVFAGYTGEMHEFFASDPGLKSRIPAEIEFPDYTTEEVAEIAAAVLSKKWKFNAPLFAEVAASAYDSLPTSERSNGRWARTFTERVVARHNRHLVDNDVRGEEMKHIPDEVLREFAP
ncbi:AAA family ATPase [Arthrobacter rhombi]|uniref:AAA family ATPase n=1 Tax=Arthrobacter rhombi TaxID=71253 RepID=UPI003FD137B2